MNLQKVIEQLELECLTEPVDFGSVDLTFGYASDMLSCVMTGAQHGALWVTLVSSLNIVAVASLLELPAVIITEDAQPDQDTLIRANQQGITLLSTPLGSFEVIGHLWEMGLRGQ